MKKQIILFLSIFFLGINSIYAKETVKFSDCVDGDTIKVLVDGKENSISSGLKDELMKIIKEL